MSMKIDVYFDYQCPYTWTVQLWLQDVKRELGDELEITWKFFSVEQVNLPDGATALWDLPNDGSHSNMHAFQGALAAMNQGDEAKFLAFQRAVFDARHLHNRNIGTDRFLLKTAEDVGLDVERFKADLTSDAAFAKLKEEHTYAKDQLGIFGVPTIVFENGQAAYLRVEIGNPPKDPMKAWDEFVAVARDRPELLEIKRPELHRGEH